MGPSHFDRDPDLYRLTQDRLALHRTRQADQECFNRKLQWPSPGRVAERNPVPIPASCTRHAGRLAHGLQHRTPPPAPRMADACGVRTNLQPAMGPDAAQSAKLRAGPRCTTRPERQNSIPESRSRWIKVRGTVTCDLPVALTQPKAPFKIKGVLKVYEMILATRESRRFPPDARHAQITWEPVPLVTRIFSVNHSRS